MNQRLVNGTILTVYVKSRGSECLIYKRWRLNQCGDFFYKSNVGKTCQYVTAEGYDLLLDTFCNVTL